MHTMIKNMLYVAVLSRVLSMSVMAMDSSDVMWETQFRKAAKSYGVTYEEFRQEAEIFLRDYRENHPTSLHVSSIKDLVVIEKPDFNFFNKMLGEFTQHYPEAELETTLDLFIKQQPLVRFLIPQR